MLRIRINYIIKFQYQVAATIIVVRKINRNIVFIHNFYLIHFPFATIHLYCEYHLFQCKNVYYGLAFHSLLKHMQTNQFEKLLQAYLQQFSKVPLTTGRQLMDYFEKCSKAERNGIWSCIGRQMGMSSVKVHDYFYNTW